ncbi:MAG TPA: GTP-binding protein [Kofleriaceae bacterium]|nr:GTP-binding protein [Kofleriaceae bacterium]HMG54907.1 GTP-binding protein [Kofleriaceae bacterium]
MTVPLVIVTGFLGAGKTTLINCLLARRRERGATGKLGVVVNELGEIGIDGALLGGQSARQIELPGGCVCCALGDELDATLLELVAQNPGLEAIVLETTGVAEPLPIAWAVAREPVASQVRLAAVVTLVDAANFVASRAVSASVDAQVAYADVLLVTKAEQGRASSDAERAETVAHMLAPRALVRRGTADQHAAWLEALLADPVLPERPGAPLAGQVPQPEGEVSPHVHDEHCRHLDSPAAHGIDSVWLAVERAVDAEELADQLAELPPNYVRIKGIVRDAGGGEPRWVAVHRVGPRVSSEPIAPADPQQARIVALGPGVAVADLARCVDAATVH